MNTGRSALSAVALIASLCTGAQSSAQYRLPPELRPGSIAGVVQTAPGRPAAGATVSVAGTVLQALVLPDGSFRIDDVPKGTYDVTASGPLYKTVTVEDIAVKPSQTSQLTITVTRYPLLSDVRVTTPSRREQPIYESSASVNVIEPTEAPFSAGHSLDRILSASSGMSLNGLLPSVRGSSGGVVAVGSRVGLYIDGIPLTTPDLAMPVYAAVPPAAIEQIEIVKGSATMLYGPGVISGAVNVVTPRPAERQRANVNLYTGAYTDPDPAVRWWGTRPQRFSGAELMWTQRSDAVGVMLAGNIVADDGYRQHEPQDRYSLFGRLNVFMPAGGELLVTGIAARHAHGPDALWRSVDSALFSGGSDSVAIPVTTSLRTLSLEYRGVDSKSFSFMLRGTLQATSVEDARPLRLTRESAASRYLAETHMRSFVNRRIAFVYGGLAQFDLAESPQYGDGLMRTVGAYARMEFTNLRDIVASIGSRADMVLMPEADVEHVVELSPHVGVAYHPIPSTSFRASLGRGYRSPSIGERKFNTDRFGVTVVPNPSLTAEQSWQGEVGVAHRVEWDSGSLIGDVAVYLQEYFGMIEPVFNGTSGQFTFANITRARILGSDMSVEATLAGGLFGATVSLSIVSARDLRLDSDLQGRAPLAAGGSLSWRPRPFSAVVSYRYTARVPSIDSLTSRLVRDAEQRFASSLVDLRVALELKDYIQLPLSAYVNARNILQSRGLDGLGILAPVRSIEAGLSIRL